MSSKNYYDVTKWNVGNPYEDIGEVINSIIADIKKRQTDSNMNEGGKPGAVIYIPSGDYHLRTQVVIDISYLKIMGSGHGFVSSSIRYNLPENEWADLHEVWPGGSRILVDLSPKPGDEESAGAAFYVERDGNPRISSVEFENFCIDGLHFVDDGSGMPNPENTYTNGKTGIYIGSAQDSFRLTGMGIVYLEHGVTIYHADALSIHDNFIAECGNCIELRGWGQASKITDNLMGAGYKGYSIFAENFGGLLITANNIFPRGTSSVHFRNVARSIITANRFHSFYPGMLVFEGNCSENMVSSNHFLRDNEPWAPMLEYDNGLDDLYGILHHVGVLRESSHCMKDYILAKGDILASLLFSKLFDQAEWHDSRNFMLTDGNFGAPEVLWEESCRAARQEFRGLRGMAVVPGYCGKTEAGYTISMGRVGLSLTAAVLEAAFQQVKVA